jgi:hypothetical protein
MHQYKDRQKRDSGIIDIFMFKMLGREIVYMVKASYTWGYCDLPEEQTHGLKIMKEIGEIQLVHAVVISTLVEILMSYSHGNGYI